MRVDFASRRPVGPARFDAAGDHRQALARIHRCEIALGVGAQHPGAVAAEALEKRPVRMAVPVSGSDRNQRDPGIDGVEEGRILVGRAVMGHLQHVGAHRRGAVPVEQRRPLLPLRIPGEQDMADPGRHRERPPGRRPLRP